MADFISNFNWTQLLDGLISLIAALACIMFHEMSHGFIAYRLGDRTAKEMGRLSFNPLRHIDPLGLLAFVIFRFGWAKPVQIDPRNFTHPKRGMALSALAGPVSNFVLAAVVLFVFGLIHRLLNNGPVGLAVLEIIKRTALFSVTLGIFNLIPIPPLDGSKVLFAVASDELYFKLMRYERFGFILLIVLIATGAINRTLGVATVAVYNFLANVSTFSYDLIGLFYGS